MALSHKAKAAIKGSIVDPEVAEQIIALLEADVQQQLVDLADRVQDLENAAQ